MLTSFGPDAITSHKDDILARLNVSRTIRRISRGGIVQGHQSMGPIIQGSHSRTVFYVF